MKSLESRRAADRIASNKFSYANGTLRNCRGPELASLTGSGFYRCWVPYLSILFYIIIKSEPLPSTRILLRRRRAHCPCQWPLVSLFEVRPAELRCIARSRYSRMTSCNHCIVEVGLITSTKPNWSQNKNF